MLIKFDGLRFMVAMMPDLPARRMKDAESKKGESEHLCVEILPDLLYLLSPKSCRAVFEKIVRLKMNKLFVLISTTYIKEVLI